MAEEIIDLLVKVPELNVPARTSSFYFKGKLTKIPKPASFVIQGPWAAEVNSRFSMSTATMLVF